MKIIHQWSIKNFRFFYSKKHNFTALSFSQSNYFKSTNGETFFLRLHPKGLHPEDGNFVSISLHLHENCCLKIYCKLTIIDCDEEEVHVTENKIKTLTDENELQFKKFVSISDISNIELGYLTEDILKIRCEITIFGQNNESSENIPISKSESNARVHVTRLQHDWNIGKFQYFINESDVCLASKDFCHSTQDSDKFFIRLWPRGRDCDKHLAVYFYHLHSRETEKHPQMTAQYKLSLVDSQKKEKYTKLNRHLIFSGWEFGCHRYISLDKLRNEAELLPDDNLKLNCVIELIGEEISNNVTQSNPDTAKLTKNHITRLQDECEEKMPNVKLVGNNNILNINSTASTGDISNVKCNGTNS